MIKNILISAILMAAVNISIAQQVLTPDLFQASIAKGENVQLVDVRTEREFSGGYIDNAVNIDIRQASFQNEISKLDKSKPVFVYCLSGGRSASAAKVLSQLGFREVYDLKGGMLAWKSNSLPVKTDNPNATRNEGMSKAQFRTALTSNKPVLVNFFAPWCAPCRKMAPMLEEFGNKHQSEISFLKLNADENNALRESLGITEIPTFMVYKNGEETWKHVGLVDEDQLTKALGL